jgi:hypothetical protein
MPIEKYQISAKEAAEKLRAIQHKTQPQANPTDREIYFAHPHNVLLSEIEHRNESLKHLDELLDRFAEAEATTKKWRELRKKTGEPYKLK